MELVTELRSVRRVFLPIAFAALTAGWINPWNPIATAAPIPAGLPLQPEPDPKPIPGEYVFDMVYSPDRKLLAVAEGNISFDKLTRPVRSRLTIFNAATHAIVRQVSEPDDVAEPFRGVRFSPDGKIIYLRCLFTGSVYTCDLP